jgi:hypothetical protein
MELLNTVADAILVGLPVLPKKSVCALDKDKDSVFAELKTAELNFDRFSVGG